MSTDEKKPGSAGSGSRATIRYLVLALTIVLLLAAVAPIRKHIESLRCRPPSLSVIDDPSQLDDKHLELLELDPPSWVRLYFPGQSHAGYNLVLFRRRVPLIIDMNGRVVHSWPEVRGSTVTVAWR